MNYQHLTRPACAAILTAALTACSASGVPDGIATAAPPAVPTTTATTPPTAIGLAHMTVHKTPTCGCCSAWIDHMRAAGFTVEVHDMDDLAPVKTRLGVPYGKGSCHTAEVGGYLVEGHVPAEDIKRLLAEKPDARGLVVPGMPLGSPGMEMPDGRQQPYTVELIGRDGSATPWAQH